MNPEIKKRKVSRIDKNGNPYTWQSKEYYIRYTTATGALKYENTHETTYEKAKEYKNKYFKKTISIIRTKKDTLLDYIEKNGWLKAETIPLYIDFKSNLTHGIQERTAYRIAKDFSKLKEWNDEILHLPYVRIGRKEAFSFRNRLANDNRYFTSRANKNQLMNELRTLFSYIMRKQDEAIIIDNPFSTKILDRFQYKDSEKSKYVFKPEEIKTMFNDFILEKILPDPQICSQREWKTILQYYVGIFKFLAYTGMRVSECLAAQVNQVNSHIMLINRAYKDPNQRIVRLPKSGEDRIIVLSQSAYDVIKKNIFTKKPDELIFTNSLGHMIHSSSADYYFQIFKKVIRKQMGIAPTLKKNEIICLHSFRKSLNTNLLERSDLKESYVAAYQGWTTTKGAEMAPVQAKNYTEYQVVSLYKVAVEIDKQYSDKKMSWKPEIHNESSLLMKEKAAEIMDSKLLAAKYRFQRIIIESIRSLMKGNPNPQDTNREKLIPDFEEIITKLDNISYEDFCSIHVINLKRAFGFDIEKSKEIDFAYNNLKEALFQYGPRELTEDEKEEIRDTIRARYPEISEDLSDEELDEMGLEGAEALSDVYNEVMNTY